MGNLGEIIETLDMGDVVVITWYNFETMSYKVMEDIDKGIHLSRPYAYAYACNKNTDDLLQRIKDDMAGDNPVIENYTIFKK